MHPNDGLKIACMCHRIAACSPQGTSQRVVPHQPSTRLEEASDAVIFGHLHKYSGYAITITDVSSDIDPSNNVGVLLSIYTLGVDLWHRLKNKRWVAVAGKIISRLSRAPSSSCGRANPSLRTCKRSAALEAAGCTRSPPLTACAGCSAF